MADNSIANDLMISLGNAISAQANRPQKTSSTITSTPLQLADMLARRNSIGNASANLAKSLKQREGLWYNLAAALSNVPQQQGYGNWLSGGAKSFGDAFNSRANMAMDNAQKQYDASRTDLADALMFDKAMGEKQTEDIGYNGDSGYGGKNQPAPQIPLIDSNVWDSMISNFDKSRPTELDYRNQTQQGRKLSNASTFLGDADENYAREQFNRYKGQDFLPLARNALKGTGTITDFEDKKYTEWINKVNDPVQLKDVAVKIINDAATRNNFTTEQKNQVLYKLGLTSTQQNLLPAQQLNEPFRIEQGNASSGGYSEGTIIQNNAGDRMILRNGQWQKI